MREILFRGKGNRYGKWVEGFYTPILTGHGMEDAIITGTDRNCSIPTLVIPETIEQYTGLTDKNGVKIFEGDIIKVHKSDTYVIKYGEYTPRNYCLARYYDKPMMGFYAYDGERCFQLSTNSRCYEVIGNIHDNPELAEGLL